MTRRIRGTVVALKTSGNTLTLQLDDRTLVELMLKPEVFEALRGKLTVGSVFSTEVEGEPELVPGPPLLVHE